MIHPAQSESKFIFVPFQLVLHSTLKSKSSLLSKWEHCGMPLCVAFSHTMTEKYFFVLSNNIPIRKEDNKKTQSANSNRGRH